MRVRLILAVLAYCGMTALALGILRPGPSPAGFGPEPQSAEAALLSEVKKLTASDAQAGDVFGWSVAISGDSAIVGAQREDVAGDNAGAAYVFDLLQPKPTPIDMTGTWNVSIWDLSGEVLLDTCVHGINQAGSSLVLEGTCGIGGAATGTGTIDPLTGDFSLSGTVGGSPIILGEGATDGETMSGTWINEFEQTGLFTGTKKPTDEPNPLPVVRVAGTGTAGDCTDAELATDGTDCPFDSVADGSVGDSGGGGGSGEAATASGLALYVADTGNNKIRRVQPPEPGGKVTRVAGAANGKPGSGGDGGDPLSAKLNGPRDVVLDASGDIYIADTENCVVRKIDVFLNQIDTFAGDGTCDYGGDGFAATSAQLNRPDGLAVDASGNVYIADTHNCVVRKVSGGIITTVVGTGSCGYDGDGGDAIVAKLNLPHDVAFLGTDLVIADTGNHRIRRYDPASGVITLLAGTGTPGDTGDGGFAVSAQLNGPEALAAAADRVFIADTQNNRIRRVNTNTGIITTFIGDGGEVSADLNLPAGIAFTGSGGGGSGEAASGGTTGSGVVCSSGSDDCGVSGGVDGSGDRTGDFTPTIGCDLLPGSSSIDWALPAVLIGLLVIRKRIGALFIRLRSAAVRHPGRRPAEDAA